MCRNWSRPHLSTSALWFGLVIAAMYCMMYLLASVFPAPLSPEMQKLILEIALKCQLCINSEASPVH